MKRALMEVRMFTGIVRGLCEIKSIQIAPTFGRITIWQSGDVLTNLCIGDSVSIDGVCLTVVKIDGEQVEYDVVKSTLDRTIIRNYQVGTKVNVERSLKEGGDIGGHSVSGHVDTCGTVVLIEDVPGSRCIHFELPHEFGRYVFPRGFICVNGVSLTISDRLNRGGQFTVWLIPETLRVTNLNDVAIGTEVNIEFDRGTQVVVDTIEAAINQFLLTVNRKTDSETAIADLGKSILLLGQTIKPLVIGRSENE